MSDDPEIQAAIDEIQKRRAIKRHAAEERKANVRALALVIGLPVCCILVLACGLQIFGR